LPSRLLLTRMFGIGVRTLWGVAHRGRVARAEAQEAPIQAKGIA